MLRITFDTNCVIDIEESHSTAETLRRLIELATTNSITLCVPAIMASERAKNGVLAPSFAAFKIRLEAVGLEAAEILLPLGYWDITFFDYCLWPESDNKSLEPRIHDVLFPDIPFSWPDYCTKYQLAADASFMRTGWLNAKCDVLALWSHIYHDGDVFVTSDRNFHKMSKRPRLKALGANSILYPSDALIRAKSLQSSN